MSLSSSSVIPTAKIPPSRLRFCARAFREFAAILTQPLSHPTERGAARQKPFSDGVTDGRRESTNFSPLYYIPRCRWLFTFFLYCRALSLSLSLSVGSSPRFVLAVSDSMGRRNWGLPTLTYLDLPSSVELINSRRKMQLQHCL